MLSVEPAHFQRIFRNGIVAALRKGITAQNAPDPEQNPRYHSEIVDRLQHILRTSRAVQTGMFGKIFLVKQNQAHTCHFQIRPKYCFPQPLVQAAERSFYSFHNPSLFTAPTKLFSNAAKEWFSACFGSRINAYEPPIFAQYFRKTSRKSRLIRLRCTLFPCFLLTHTPSEIDFAGRYRIIKVGEKIFFPLVKTFVNSVFFLIRVYNIVLLIFSASGESIFSLRFTQRVSFCPYLFFF